jgi:hypothetical protein
MHFYVNVELLVIIFDYLETSYKIILKRGSTPSTKLINFVPRNTGIYRIA